MTRRMNTDSRAFSSISILFVSCRLRLRLGFVRRAAVWTSGTRSCGRGGALERGAAAGSVGEALEEDGSRGGFFLVT